MTLRSGRYSELYSRLEKDHNLRFLSKVFFQEIMIALKGKNFHLTLIRVVLLTSEKPHAETKKWIWGFQLSCAQKVWITEMNQGLHLYLLE